MDDLISRKAAIDQLHQSYNLLDAEDRINALISAEPEIIRCKDCKYGSPNKVYGCRLDRFSEIDKGVRLYGNDFCSRAERRTDETD